MEAQWTRDGQWLGDPDRIAEEIRITMIRQHLKQADIMTMLGYSRQALARRFRGDVRWRDWELSTIARRLGIPRQQITGENHVNDTHVGDSP